MFSLQEMKRDQDDADDDDLIEIIKEEPGQYSEQRASHDQIVHIQALQGQARQHMGSSPHHMNSGMAPPNMYAPGMSPGRGGPPGATPQMGMVQQGGPGGAMGGVAPAPPQMGDLNEVSWRLGLPLGYNDRIRLCT